VRVFVDTDPGIDDAVALAYLSARPEVDLVGVGAVFGNNPVDVTTDNALKLLELFDRPGVPVGRGAAGPLVGEAVFAEHVHGENGLGGVEVPAAHGEAQAGSAAELLVQLARVAPGEIHVLSIGTLTNLALALAIEPDLPRMLGRVVVMGGAVTHPGNTTAWAEHNIVKDPEAAERVLGAGFDLTLVTLDVTMRTLANGAWLDRLGRASGTRAEYCSRFLEFYTRYYSANVLNQKGCPVHDPLAAGILLDPSLITAAHQVPVRVELAGEHTRGMTIADLRAVPADDDRPPVRLPTEVDSGRFLEELLAGLA
jgi:purine nucleosidase